VTPSEREAFDALLRYAELGEDWENLHSPESVDAYIQKWKPVADSLWDGIQANEYALASALEHHFRHLALEKAREVQAARDMDKPKVKSTLKAGDSFNVEGSSDDYMKLFDILVNPGKNREEAREGGE